MHAYINTYILHYCIVEISFPLQSGTIIVEIVNKISVITSFDILQPVFYFGSIFVIG